MRPTLTARPGARATSRAQGRAVGPVLSEPADTVAGMTLTVEMITFDSLDARALAAWWAERTGGTVLDDNDGWYVMVVPADGSGPRLGFQKVADPTPGKNRVHLDLHAADPATAVDDLVAAGATFVARHDAGSFRWAVLADPDGNQFCVTEPPGS
jgi:hypothetical protein